MILKNVLACSALFALTACATNLQQLNKTDVSGNTFNAHLAQGYKNLAQTEANDYDWRHSEHFAKKGIAAANGQDVKPDEPNGKKIKDANELRELNAAYEDLNKALGSRAKIKHPKKLAEAQVHYDCWVEEATEGWQMDDIKSCKDKFYALMVGSLFKHGGKLNIKAVEDGYTVYFNLNSSELNKIDHENIAKMASYLKADMPNQIIVHGHTDTVGSKSSNKALSIKRAHHVVAQLKHHGIPSHKFKVKGFGEENLAVPTEDNVKEPLNRRVEIKALK